MLAVALIIFNGCQKEGEFYEENPYLAEEQDSHYNEGKMVIGEKLKNPYSVQNMHKAYNNLRTDNKLKSAVNIETTHFYVRFRPKSFQELNILTRDTTLHIYDYPLDVEIKRGGTHYHDPSIPRNQITWQYTVVPVDYTFPNIQHQKLADLFLQEETGKLEELKSGSIDYFDWLTLETEALRITGNLKEDEPNGVELKSTRWRPCGTIKVHDDILIGTTTEAIFDHWEYYPCPEDTENPNDPSSPEEIVEDLPYEECRRAVYRYEIVPSGSHLIALKGATVRARRWFTTHKGITDANGTFVCDGTFSRDANYSIKWERWDFDIRDGQYGQAYFNGPKQSGPWNLNIESEHTPKSHLFAHIFRAAHTYYYDHNHWGIKAPPRRDGVLGALQHRLHIAGIDGPGRSKYYTFKEFALAAQIKVYRNNGNSKDIFGTTIHELSHASHWEIGYSTSQYVVDAIFSGKRLPESWATGVETVILDEIYGTNHSERKQHLRISDMTNGGEWDGYTCIVWDMIDTHNQRDNGQLFPDDDVENYTLSQLEGALFYSPSSWWGWRDEIKNRFNNPTGNHLDKLFDDLN